jgi:hypothetical protein
VGGLATVLLDTSQLVLLGCCFDMAIVTREYAHKNMTAFRFAYVRIDWLKPVLPLHMQPLADASSLNWKEVSLSASKPATTERPKTSQGFLGDF